jgi:endonuclease YncB( thermonuclease family)
MIRHWVSAVVLVAGVGATGAAFRAAMQPTCLEVQLTPVHVARTIDGDTFILLAFGVPPEERVRILGVDTPELHDSLTTKAREARDYTRAWLADGPFTITTCKRDSFGRYLATVTRGTTDTLAVDLIRAGLGVKR